MVVDAVDCDRRHHYQVQLHMLLLWLTIGIRGKLVQAEKGTAGD